MESLPQASVWGPASEHTGRSAGWSEVLYAGTSPPHWGLHFLLWKRRDAGDDLQGPSNCALLDCRFLGHFLPKRGIPPHGPSFLNCQSQRLGQLGKAMCSWHSQRPQGTLCPCAFDVGVDNRGEKGCIVRVRPWLWTWTACIQMLVLSCVRRVAWANSHPVSSTVRGIDNP